MECFGICHVPVCSSKSMTIMHRCCLALMIGTGSSICRYGWKMGDECDPLDPVCLTPLQVPIAQDEMALSLGYAASLEATAYGDSAAESVTDRMHDSTESSQLLEALPSGQRASQELDETTRSDVSERPSVEDVESETGSTGALETRSLKDHKGKDELLNGN